MYVDVTVGDSQEKAAMASVGTALPDRDTVFAAELAEKFDGYAGFRHKVLFITKGGRDRLTHVVEHTRPVETIILLTTYDLVTGSEDEAIWYGVSLKGPVTLPR